VHVGDRVLDPGGGEPGVDGVPCSCGSCKCTGCALLLTGATRWVRRPRSISAGLGGVRSDIKERAEASRHPCEDDVAAFSHGSEAGSPELSVYSIAEGVVPGGVAGVASEARRLEVSSSAVDETELPPAIAVCTKGADGLADQRLEHRREEAKVRRNHRLKLTVVEYVLPAWPGYQLDTGDSAR
jgi:hypothetical protein